MPVGRRHPPRSVPARGRTATKPGELREISSRAQLTAGPILRTGAARTRARGRRAKCLRYGGWGCGSRRCSVEAAGAATAETDRGRRGAPSCSVPACWRWPASSARSPQPACGSPRPAPHRARPLVVSTARRSPCGRPACPSSQPRRSCRRRRRRSAPSACTARSSSTAGARSRRSRARDVDRVRRRRLDRQRRGEHRGRRHRHRRRRLRTRSRGSRAPWRGTASRSTTPETWSP